MWGYSMSADLMGVETKRVKDEQVMPMFFETDTRAQDVVANLAARSVARNKSGSNIARVDTSTRFVRASETLSSPPLLPK